MSKTNQFQGRVGYDYLMCPVCGQKCLEISAAHARSHGFDRPLELAKAFGLKSSKCGYSSDKMRGSQNPAYQHNGKYSIWSKNYINGYDQSRHHQAQLHNQKWQDKHKDHYKTRFEYWLKVTNNDVARAEQLYKEFQTRDLAWFNTQFGPIEGPVKRQKWIKSIQTSLANRPLADKIESNKKKLQSRKSSSVSKKEQKLVAQLMRSIPDLSTQLILPYQDNLRSRYFIYDIVYQSNIIEFNGTFWHTKPGLYESSYINPYKKKSAEQIWQDDAFKQSIAEAHGYKFMTVWEDDFDKDPTQTVQNCFEFLTQGKLPNE